MDRFISDSIKLLITKLAGAFLSILASIVLTKLYGVDAFGIYALSLQIITIAATLANKGITHWIVKYGLSISIDSNYNKWFRKTNTDTNLRAFRISIILLLFFYLLNQFFPDKELYLFSISLLTLPFFVRVLNYSSFYTGIKKAWFGNLFEGVLNNIIIVIISLIIPITVRNLNEKVVLIILLITTYAILGILITWSYKRSFKKIDNKEYSVQKIKDSTSNKELFSLTLTSQIIPTLIPLFVLLMISDEILGIVNVLLKICAPITFIYFSIQRAVSPYIAENYLNRDIKSIKNIFHKASFLSSIPGIIFSIIIYIFKQPILEIYGLNTIENSLLLNLIMIGFLINASTSITSPMLIMCGEQKKASYINMVGLISLGLLSFIFIHYFSIYGIGCSYICIPIILNIPKLLVIRNKFYRNANI